MVLRRGPQINEEFNRILQQQVRGAKTIDIEEIKGINQQDPAQRPRTRADNAGSLIAHQLSFEIRTAKILVNAQLLPSLSAIYELKGASSSGRVYVDVNCNFLIHMGVLFRDAHASNFDVSLEKHQLGFVLIEPSVAGVKSESGTSSIPLDTFTLPLPGVSVTGDYVQEGAVMIESAGQQSFLRIEEFYPQLRCRTGGFYNIVAIIGRVEHTFSVDLMNQILFAEQRFRSELRFLIDRLSSERPKNESGTVEVFNVKRILFNLEVSQHAGNIA